MRFASIATLASALAVLPFVVSLGRPMEANQFVQSARCIAYERATGAESFGQARINAEARWQSMAATIATRTAILEARAHAGARVAACAAVS